MIVHCVSKKGRREDNEDSHKIITNLNNKDDSLNNVNYYSISDGHGGKYVSKFINANLHKLLITKGIPYPLNIKRVNGVYDFLQFKLTEMYPEIAMTSGSTNLTVIQFQKNNNLFLNVINLGDCRCVLCRSSVAIPITKDHKPNWSDERSRIEKIGGDIIFDGVDWRIKDLSVSRAFGDVDAKPYVTHIPELFSVKMSKKTDKFFIMACDGLWDVFSSQDAVNFVLDLCYDNNGAFKIDIANVNVAKLLAKQAFRNGSTDNVTIIIAFLNFPKK